FVPSESYHELRLPGSHVLEHIVDHLGRSVECTGGKDGVADGWKRLKMNPSLGSSNDWDIGDAETESLGLTNSLVHSLDGCRGLTSDVR
ncbi:hypothetical protein PFISCL1PPCAC_108, partial [Pristionchus fissidentatus]